MTFLFILPIAILLLGACDVFIAAISGRIPNMPTIPSPPKNANGEGV